jgi:hypothetical protein
MAYRVGAVVCDSILHWVIGPDGVILHIPDLMA